VRLYDEVMRTTSVLVGCGTLLLLATIVGCERHETQKDVVDKVFGNQTRFDTVAKAETVTAERVHLSKNLDSSGLNSYQRGSPITIASAQSAELRKLLTEPALYDFDSATTKSCIVNYGVIVSFHSGPRTIQVGLCFDCNWLGIFEGAGGSGVPIKEEVDFASARKELVKLMKAIFANDPEIQALRETTHRAR
jgi:hypothetical protein